MTYQVYDQGNQSRFGPGFWIAVVLILMVSCQLLLSKWLLLAVGVMLVVGWRTLPKLGAMLWRMRWFFTVLWLTTAYQYPGDPLFDLRWLPTSLGVNKSNEQMLSVVAIIQPSLLLAQVLSRQQCWSGCYTLILLLPKAWQRLSERGLLRLFLCIAIINEGLPPRGSATWSHYLSELLNWQPPLSFRPEYQQMDVYRIPWNRLERLVLIAFAAASMMVLYLQR